MNRVTLFDGATAWLVTGHSHSRRLLADPRVSADRSRPDFPVVLPRFEADVFKPLAIIGFDPPQHGLQRGLLTADFSMRSVRAKRESIERLVESLADRMLAAGPPADLVLDYSLPIPSMVVADLLGVPYADHQFFEDATVRLLQATTPQGAEAAGEELLNYLDEQIRLRERDPDDTLLSRLGEHVHDEGLGRDIINKIALALLVGGHDTTSQMIALGVVTLLDHPDQLAILRSDPSALPGVVEELLRMVSVTDLAGVRVATEDVEIDGQVIARGEGLIFCNSMANRDPAVYDAPYEFDVRRSADDPPATRRHLTFGHGPHQCIGRNLARMELEIAYRVLFEKIPNLRLAVPRDELPMRHGSTMQGVHRLPVTW
ncbi:Cytochrome P450 (sca-2) [Frankia alni ACN14a]|uniref:Cytochrome P450 (Sca-2) n=2 Tax=Frankiaceae TaxID=74712 RepID=Q0RID2_FRAAA|nr:Cytochrome P450 (sca-2) [Frankia alni ACN14a]